MFTSETQIRVRYAETDQMGVVYHGNYAQYFETARAESIRHLGFTYKDMEALGVMMPVVELNTKFIRAALYDELLTVKVILKEFPTTHRIEFDHEVYNEKMELLTTAQIVLYFMDIKTMKKTTMPEQLGKMIKPYFKNITRDDDPLSNS